MKNKIDLKQNVSRKTYVDVARGMALFLVVLGHLVQIGGKAFTWIFSFHMMLFFFLSGYVFNSDKYANFSFSKYLQKKVDSIIVPFFIVALVGWSCCFIFPPLRGVGNNVTELLLYYAQPENLNVGQIWFLMCLFWTEIMFFLIYQKLFSKVNLKCIAFITILISIIGFNIDKVTFLSYPRLPWKIDSALTAFVFYTLGYYIKKSDLMNKLFFHKVFSLIIMIICFIVSFYISVYKNGYVNMCDCKYGDYFYFYLASFCGIIFMMILAMFCEKIKILQYYGRNTLWMFSLHSFLLILSEKVLNLLTGQKYLKMINIPFDYCLIISLAVYLVLGTFPFIINWCKNFKNILKTKNKVN